MIEPILHGVGAYTKGETIGPVCWPHYDLIIVTKGSAHFSLPGGKSFSCEAGSTFFIPPNHRFSGKSENEGCEIWVQHFRILRRCLPPAMRLPRKPALWHHRAACEWTRALMRQAADLQKQNKRETWIVGHILILLLHALQKKPSTSPKHADSVARKLEAIRKFALAQSHNPLSIQDLAAHAGWSISYFRAMFRKHCKCSVGAWLKNLRMEEASRLLRETRHPIKEIAFRMGYSDLVSFHRAFTRHTGITPAVCRMSSPRLV